MIGKLTISEVARQAGIRASAIRYYESVGLLPPPQRVSGQRRYHEDAEQHRIGPMCGTLHSVESHDPVRDE